MAGKAPASIDPRGAQDSSFRRLRAGPAAQEAPGRNTDLDEAAGQVRWRNLRLLLVAFAGAGAAWFFDRSYAPMDGEALPLRWVRALGWHPCRSALALGLLLSGLRPGRLSVQEGDERGDRSQEGPENRPEPGNLLGKGLS
ncbi:MAG: hypothetical protein AAF368_14570 [Planctomycetota bacterium]